NASKRFGFDYHAPNSPGQTMILDANSFDIYHFLETLAGGLGSACVFFFTLWKYHKADMREREGKADRERVALLKAAEYAEVKSQQRHAENRSVLTDISTQLRYHPPHRHVERKGPLNA